MKKILKFFEKKLKLFIPPIFSLFWRKVRPRRVRGHLIYAPDGIDTKIQENGGGWDSDHIAKDMESEIENFTRQCQSSASLSFSHLSSESGSEDALRIHNLHMTWAYVISLASRKKEKISILDWGGGLGHFYQIAKAIFPGDPIDYHCKEVASTVSVGRRVNPNITWHDDDTCLARTFDLVLVSGSLQYMENWTDFIRNLSSSVESYLLLLRTPIVDDGPGFFSIQQIGETELLHQQFSEPDIINEMENCGFILVREFFDGSRLKIVQAKVECELKGWLFKKK